MHAACAERLRPRYRGCGVQRWNCAGLLLSFGMVAVLYQGAWVNEDLRRSPYPLRNGLFANRFPSHPSWPLQEFVISYNTNFESASWRSCPAAGVWFQKAWEFQFPTGRSFATKIATKHLGKAHISYMLNYVSKWYESDRVLYIGRLVDLNLM